jgi:LPS export ABC transporter protein LptC
MPVYSRNLLLFLVLAATALMTWMLARNAERETISRPSSQDRAPQGYYMRDAVLYGTDENGVITFRVDATRVDHESSESDYGLEKVRVEYAEESGVSWRLTAERGQMTADRVELELQTVQLRAVARQSGKTFVFDARDLSVDLVAETATTDQRVQLQTGECESDARGLNVDLKGNTFELLNIVAACRIRSRPVIAGALLAGGAFAQEGPPAAPERPQTETYGFEYFRCTGDLGTDQYVCENLVITRGASFRLTAGQATVNDGSLPTTMQLTEWHLTDGVQLQFETAVMNAETAEFSYDADGELESFDMAGAPVELSDFIEGRPAPVRVRGSRIVYSVESGTLKMPGQVELVEDGNDKNGAYGCDLTYWFVEKRVQLGSAQCGGRISLAPVEAGNPGAETPADP